MECIKEKLEKKDIEAKFTLKETRSYPESKKNQRSVFCPLFFKMRHNVFRLMENIQKSYEKIMMM